MRLTVLGKSPAFPDAGGACSGYLVEEGDFSLLIDCGNGVFAKLRERTDYTHLDAVLISHLHADHILDLVPFSYALTLGRGAGPDRRRIPLHAPPGAGATFRRIVGAWGSEELIESAFEIDEYGVEAELRLGPLEVALHRVPHFAVTHAVELRAPSGGRLLYGADGRAGEELVGAATGVDVLIAEATLPEPADAPLAERGHMSPAEAGRVAAEAGAGRLVLTHISDQLDAESCLARAAEHFDGPVEVAYEGLAIEL
jgi:ribonuclease BN (tRNA processing enzyme)